MRCSFIFHGLAAGIDRESRPGLAKWPGILVGTRCRDPDVPWPQRNRGNCPNRGDIANCYIAGILKKKKQGISENRGNLWEISEFHASA